MSPTKRLARNLGYAVLIVLWLAVMLVPCFAFALIARGELEWQRGEESDRVWLIQERDQKGLGYQAQRLISNEPSNGAVCIQTTVQFLLWEGAEEAQNAEYCECRTADGATQPIDCP